MLVPVLLLVAGALFLFLFIGIPIMRGRALMKAVRAYHALPPEMKRGHVIRTDTLLPHIGKRIPQHLWWRTRFGMVVYQDPEMGPCLVETCELIPEDSIFN